MTQRSIRRQNARRDGLRQPWLDRARSAQLLDLLGVIAQRLQNLVVVFAEVRRRRPDLAIEAGDLAGLRDQVEFAEAGMGDRSLQTQRLNLGIGKSLLDVV